MGGVWSVKRSESREPFVLDKEKNGSQRAELSYQTLTTAENGKVALLEVEPLTGRQHQIRAQLARIDHPLLFDVKYSNRGGDRAIVPAIGLWAYRLVLTHPTTGKVLTFISVPDPVPGSAWEPFAPFLRAGEVESKENPPPRERDRAGQRSGAARNTSRRARAKKPSRGKESN